MELQYTEWILETIDSLRSRKARPDLERICRMIERRHGLPPAETQQQLDKLVRAELVVKVAYKGSNSYRNAAKWYKNKQRKRGGAAPGPAPGGGGILQAVHSLLLQRRREEEEVEEEEPHQQTHQQTHQKSQQEAQQQLQQTHQKSQQQLQQTHQKSQRESQQQLQQTHQKSQRDSQQQLQQTHQKTQQESQQQLQQTQQPPQQHREPLLGRHSSPRGVSLRDIERHLGRKLGRARLQLALRREVHRGRLLQTPAGTHYLLPPGSGEPAAGSPAGAPPIRKQPTHTGYGRTRREKAIEASASLVNPSEAAAPPDSECMEPELKEIEEWRNPDLERGAPETESMEPVSQQNNCKNKTAPEYTQPTESSVFLNCDTYKKSRGMNGHTQDVSGHSTDQWLYGKCVTSFREEAAKRMLLVRLPSPDLARKNDTAKEEAEQRAAVPELRGASCLPTPSASPVEMESIESGSNKSPTENSKLLDPAQWTILDVFNYFKKAGFEDQAMAFQEQEIDGKSLLLMKRSDVLTGLAIKLGPALKIYEYHVKALQMRHLKSSSS